MPTIEIVDTAQQEWSASPTGTPGCAGKAIFRYSDERLGSHGHSGPYTVIYRFDAGAAYPPVYILEEPCELGVQSGTLKINDVKVMAGSWARCIPDDKEPVIFSSEEGCELIAVVRGRIRLADSQP